MEYAEYASIRDKVGLKDSNVAKISGVGQSTFSDWKSGRSKPKQEKLQKIREAIGEDVWDSSVLHQKEVNFFTGNVKPKLLHEYTYGINKINICNAETDGVYDKVKMHFKNELDHEYKLKVEKILINDQKRKLLMGLIDTLSED